ncbi:hypothetical protein MAP00_008238 [Monascus purpureus]|nr:hypothetical protein MAP00_008238 [Monascus purpureus]
MPEQKGSSALSTKIDKKRKRHAEDSSHQKTTPEKTPSNGYNNNPEGPSKKKRKKTKNKTEKLSQKQDVEDLERKGGIDESIGEMDGRLLADHFAQKARKLNKELTAVELEDIYVQESTFLDTTSFTSSRSLDKLPDFLNTFKPKGCDLSKSAEEKGSPHTLVISPAALRAADIVRALRKFQTKESIIGKLFAKHIKLEEAKQFLQRARHVYPNFNLS